MIARIGVAFYLFTCLVAAMLAVMAVSARIASDRPVLFLAAAMAWLLGRGVKYAFSGK
jgi:hypothetical protein